MLVVAKARSMSARMLALPLGVLRLAMVLVEGNASDIGGRSGGLGGVVPRAAYVCS
jgi:hypothetical protein